MSNALFEAIERRSHERTVPRHMGMIAVLKALFPKWIRWGVDRFDPDRTGSRS